LRGNAVQPRASSLLAGLPAVGGEAAEPGCGVTIKRLLRRLLRGIS